MAAAKSNVAAQGNGSDIYARSVRPAKVDWEKVGAHYAVSALFEDYPRETAIYCYDASREDQQVFTAGRAKLAFGRVRLTSRITQETARLNFGVLHLGDHNISGGVGEFRDDASYQSVIESAVEPFRRADLTAVLRVMERRFGESNYSLRSLFHDQQRSVLTKILAANLAEAAALYRQIYESRAPLMRFLTDLGIPLPKGFAAAAEFVLNQDLRAALEQTQIDRAEVTRLFESAKAEGIALDMTALEFAYPAVVGAGGSACLRRNPRWPHSNNCTTPRAFFKSSRSRPISGKSKIFFISCGSGNIPISATPKNAAMKRRAVGSLAAKISAACSASN